MANERAFSYVVKASDGNELPCAVSEQRRLIAKYAQSAGFHLVKEYEGRLGAAQRVWTEMENSAKQEEVTAVLLSYASFTADNWLDTLRRVIAMHRQGVEIIGAVEEQNYTEELCRHPKYDKIMRVLPRLLHRAQRQRYHKMRKGAMAKRDQEGKCEGQKRFGYYPSEQEVIKRFQELQQPGPNGKRPTCAAIARTLNKEGYKNRSGGDWTGPNLRKVMKSAGVRGS